MKVWKIIFLSKLVICRFQPLIFQGVVSGREGLAVHCSPGSPQMRPVGMNLSPNGLALQATRDAQRCAFPVDGLVSGKVGFRNSEKTRGIETVFCCV